MVEVGTTSSKWRVFWSVEEDASEYEGELDVSALSYGGGFRLFGSNDDGESVTIKRLRFFSKPVAIIPPRVKSQM